ncbi:PilZ domain-containing protein [candidate division FCPU426 bacterium]|nr:PilZ domain-containing protein [candidate division FCPU426 bacterium]
MKGFGSAEFDRRRYPRLNFSLPLAFQVSGDHPHIPKGVSANVSLGGLMAYLPQNVTPGEILEVTMLLPLGDEKKTCRAQAEVVWSQNGVFDSGWSCRAGVRFLDMPPESKEIWQQFLRNWQGDKPR